MKNNHDEIVCRACGLCDETQLHLMQCKVINENDNENTHENDHEGIYSPDINAMFRVTKAMKRRKKILKRIVENNFNPQLTPNPSLASNAEDTDLQDQQKEARSLTIFNAREEEQQKFTNLIAPKTPEQEQEQEEAQSLTIINAREEKQHRGVNLNALKTSG